jgi:hypothetical protein
MNNRPRITHVAIRLNGKIYSLLAPNRHHDVIRYIIDTTEHTHVDVRDEDQGFLDASGRYLNRKQALASALLNGQIKEGTVIRMNMLFSEDVW